MRIVMGEVVDSLLVHAHVFTMAGSQDGDLGGYLGVGYLADGAVAVRGDTIVAVGATADLEGQYAAREVIDASGHALLPGLIDAHMHTPYAVVRGVAQDVANWMQRGLAVYSRHLLPAASLAGTRLNVLEALKTGTTTLGDYATPHEGWADIFAEVGVRAVLTPTINALPRGRMADWRVGELYPLDEGEGDREQRTAICSSAGHSASGSCISTVGLADDHEWAGGASTAKNGIVCNANMPTEEVFTTPHRERVNGYVRASKPLSYMGALIEDISVRFEAGRIVEANARAGADVLRKVLETDEGASRLGEVALVPHASPISKSGLLFFNTLFDENAASHIALGQAYSKCFVNGDRMSETELAARGANRSLIHIDWMIGSGDMDVDGLDSSGARTAVMRQGEFVI